MIFIANFNNTRELSDIMDLYEEYNRTNIDFLLEGFTDGETTWSVPKKAAPGDTIVFMCAMSARNNLGMATSHLPEDVSEDFRSFVDRQKTLYKQYSGHLLGYGIVSSSPQYDGKWWMSNIGQLRPFASPVHIDDFRSFISISKTNSITYLDNNQWERLKWVVNQKNPVFFTNVTAPDVKVLEKEFDDDVRKAASKPLDKLKKEAEKKRPQPSTYVVNTTVYNRDPVVAAYVKRRANGHCQLCGMNAPFTDPNGEPYLECHHISWLSKGGTDSPDNCVALCPNCHRKIHSLNLTEDVNTLKAKAT